jgi:hypothetical protein
LFLFLARFAFLTTLLVAELTVVHEASNRRGGIRRDFYEVKTAFARGLQRLLRQDDPELVPVFIDQAYFTNANALVDAYRSGAY